MFLPMLPLMNWAPPMPLKLKPKLIWLMWMTVPPKKSPKKLLKPRKKPPQKWLLFLKWKLLKLVESVDENTTEISLTSFAVVNPGEQNYTVTVEGEGSEAFTYNEETNSLEITEALIMKAKKRLN